METTPTPFDLNQAIQKWRDRLGQSPVFRSANLYELETHLRDSLAALRAGGLSDEEAFLIAVRRLGPDGPLEAEFGKINRSAVWLDRALWILIGAQVWILGNALSNSFEWFLNFQLPRFNDWLADYGFGRISEPFFARLCYVLTFPLLVLAAIKLYSAFHRRAEKHGWSPMASLLSRPRLLAATYGLLFLLPVAFRYGMLALMQSNRLERNGHLANLSPSEAIAVLAFHTALFAGLVLFIARRRLKLCAG